MPCAFYQGRIAMEAKRPSVAPGHSAASHGVRVVRLAGGLSMLRSRGCKDEGLQGELQHARERLVHRHALLCGIRPRGKVWMVRQDLRGSGEISQTLMQTLAAGLSSVADPVTTLT